MKPSWTAPELSDMSWGVHVLAFDQTLTNCGLVAIRVSQLRVTVLMQRVIRPKTELASFYGTYAKAAQLDWELQVMLARPAPDGQGGGFAEVAYEMPSTGGHRTESALLAGFVIARRRPDAIMVSAQHVHAVLVGTKRSQETAKQEIAAAVARYVPESAGRDWNEHTRDALAIALTRLYDIRQKELTA